MNNLMYGLVAIVLVLAVYSSALVSYHTVLSDYFETKQKFAIIAIAWLVPIIGPAFILNVLSEDKPRKRKSGIPLLDIIFLTAVFTQGDNSSSLDSVGSSTHEYTGYGNGGGDGDT